MEWIIPPSIPGTEYRRRIGQYFRPERVDAFEPQSREIAAELAQSLLARDEVEFIAVTFHRLGHYCFGSCRMLRYICRARRLIAIGPTDYTMLLPKAA